MKSLEKFANSMINCCINENFNRLGTWNLYQTVDHAGPLKGAVRH
jgi:hypothetical protein